MPDSSGRLTGRVAIVTGASRGVGRGCAVALAQDGADVVVNYLTHPDEADETVREIEALGRRAVALRADVADRDQVAGMIGSTVARFGKLDIIVPNAYRSVREPFLTMSLDGLKLTLDICLLGTFHCCHLAALQMAKQGGGGSIVVIGSVHADHPYAGAVSYNMAKAGVDALVKTIAIELAPHRIRVNVIHPGWIDTPGERVYFSDEQLIAEGKRIPWGRLGRPIDVGRAAAFLASDDAEYVTGATLNVDGAIILGLE